MTDPIAYDLAALNLHARIISIPHWTKVAPHEVAAYANGHREARYAAAEIAAEADARIARLIAALEAARADAERLRLAGQPMANVAFNLKQQPGRSLTINDCAMFKRIHEQWDKAARGAA